MDTAVYASPPDSGDRLAQLGLDEGCLVEAARRGLLVKAGCTDNHPVQYPGFAAYAETVGALRERLVARGWERSDDGGVALVVDPVRGTAITVATGDDDTGLPDGRPLTKSSKGPKTAAFVTNNLLQAQLFPMRAYEAAPQGPLAKQANWILLFHVDARLRELRCELSRPVSMDAEGRVDGWIERIILASTPLDDDTVVVAAPDGPTPPNVDVEITKRA